MNIKPDEKIQIARFLNFILSGERVAHRCAGKQAAICDDRKIKKFLRLQARQEKFHAFTFQSAILWLAPKGVSCPASGHMRQYENLLLDAIDDDNLLTSILGLQVILEGMGDIILQRLNHGIEIRDIGFKKIRHAILMQEDTHHSFGLDFLNDNAESFLNSQNNLKSSENYLSLVEDIFISLQGLLEFFDSDTQDYISEFNSRLPVWTYQNALSYHSHT